MSAARRGFDFNAFHLANRTDGGRKGAPSELAALLERHWHVPFIECADGFTMSAQASEYHYCSPRLTAAHPYAEVEVGYPSERCESLMPYAEDADAPTQTVYGWVPVTIVEQLIDLHGGVAVPAPTAGDLLRPSGE